LANARPLVGRHSFGKRLLQMERDNDRALQGARYHLQGISEERPNKKKRRGTRENFLPLANWLPASVHQNYDDATLWRLQRSLYKREEDQTRENQFDCVILRKPLEKWTNHVVVQSASLYDDYVNQCPNHSIQKKRRDGCDCQWSD